MISWKIGIQIILLISFLPFSPWKEKLFTKSGALNRWNSDRFIRLVYKLPTQVWIRNLILFFYRNNHGYFALDISVFAYFSLLLLEMCTNWSHVHDRCDRGHPCIILISQCNLTAIILQMKSREYITQQFVQKNDTHTDTQTCTRTRIHIRKHN